MALRVDCLPAFVSQDLSRVFFVMLYMSSNKMIYFWRNISCVFGTICYRLLQGNIFKPWKFGSYQDLQPEPQKIDLPDNLQAWLLEFMYVHIMLFIILEHISFHVQFQLWSLTACMQPFFASQRRGASVGGDLVRRLEFERVAHIRKCNPRSGL